MTISSEVGHYPAQSTFFHGIPSKYGKNRRKKRGRALLKIKVLTGASKTMGI
jgi:hypothetical protein